MQNHKIQRKTLRWLGNVKLCIPATNNTRLYCRVEHIFSFINIAVY